MLKHDHGVGAVDDGDVVDDDDKTYDDCGGDKIKLAGTVQREHSANVSAGFKRRFRTFPCLFKNLKFDRRSKSFPI